jgi:hypothetical protein
MTQVTRLQGKTHFGTYIVSVFVEEDKISRIDVNGKPHKSVSELCTMLSRSHTKLYADSIKAIKITMAKHMEYQGERQ